MGQCVKKLFAYPVEYGEHVSVRFMKFEELLKYRRSVRNFQDRPVPVELVEMLIKQSTLAPSAGNDQPWKFVIINNKGMLKRISDESKKNIIARIAENANDYAVRYEKLLHKESFNVFYNAPCLVLILGFPHLKNMYVDCALAACYLMMAATDRGLGTCWVNLGADIRDEQMLKELGIPKDCRIIAPIILGYPVEIPPPPKRKEPDIVKIIA